MAKKATGDTHRDASRRGYSIQGAEPSVLEIMVGAACRIADGIEVLAEKLEQLDTRLWEFGEKLDHLHASPLSTLCGSAPPPAEVKEAGKAVRKKAKRRTKAAAAEAPAQEEEPLEGPPTTREEVEAALAQRGVLPNAGILRLRTMADAWDVVNGEVGDPGDAKWWRRVEVRIAGKGAHFGRARREALRTWIAEHWPKGAEE